MDALEQALAGNDAWITGIRREQSITRANAEKVEFQDDKEVWKFDPLVDSTEADVWRYLHEHDLPYLPSTTRGMLPSAAPPAPCLATAVKGAGPAGENGVRTARMSVLDSPRQPRGDHMSYEISHLRALESEAIHVIREVAAELERGVLLFSGGKDSAVLLHLARKAFHPAALPFAVMHVDTGHNFPEVIEYRDRMIAESGPN